MKNTGRQEVTFTREQFYQKVWSMPATRIAAELACSDVMIGKVCKAYDIPKPYLGYWAKLAHGKKPRKTRLPKNDDPEVQVVTFYRHTDQETTTEVPGIEPEYDPDITQMLDTARSLPPIAVSDSLRKPHPLVKAVRGRIGRLNSPFHQRFGTTGDKASPALDIRVSKECEARALRIMDALIKRIQEIGGTIEFRNERIYTDRVFTTVCFGGEEVSVIRLREKQNQVRIDPQENRLAWNRTELKPSGLLILDRGPGYLDHILIQDTPKRRRIEDGLNDLVIGFVRKAGERRIQRREEEEARRKRAEEERVRRIREDALRRRRADLKLRQDTEQDRVDELVHHARSWRKSRLIRDYLKSLSVMLVERKGSITLDGDDAAYLRWAYEQADRFDPLRPSPHSVLDEHIDE